MTRLSKTAVLLTLTAGISLAALLSGCSDLPPGVIAKGDGINITQGQLQKRVDLLSKSLPPTQGSQSSETARQALVRQAAKQLVAEALIRRESAKRGIKVSDDEVQKQINKMLALRYAGDKQQWLSDLQAEGTNETEYREGVRTQLLSNKLEADVKNSVHASDDDARREFQAFVSANKSPDFRRVRLILVSNQTLAQNLRSQIDGGADFAALAAKYNQDKNSRHNQNQLSLSKLQQAGLSPAVKNAIFSMSYLQVAGPIKTDKGYYLLQLTDVEPDRSTPFDQAKELFREKAQQKLQQQAWQQFLADAEKSVVYRDDVKPNQ